MKKKGIILSIILLLFTQPLLVSAQTEQGATVLKEGITLFQNTMYDQAVLKFRDIILNPEMKRFHGDAYYWIIKTYITLEQYDSAAKNIEFFLKSFPDHQAYQEMVYQKGRVLFLQKDYENAILVLKGFLDTYPSSPYASNSFFWIGESLFLMGHYDEAYRVYNIVVQKYPASFKVEAAQYRISLIDLKKREEELLSLLKISHEEYLKLLEEFQRKEKTYEQAITEYQRKLSALTAQDLGAQIAKLTQELGQREGEIAALKREISSLQNQLNQALSAQQTVVAQTPQNVQIPAAPDDRVREILRIKAEALGLKEFYIDWLFSHMETVQ